MNNKIENKQEKLKWYWGHEELLAQVQTGDIFLEKTRFNIKKPKSWLSYLVRKIAGIIYNHARAVIIEDNERYVIEATTPKVKKTSWVDVINDSEIEKVLILRVKENIEINQQKYIQEAKDLIGLPYDKPALLFHQLVMQMTKRIKLDIWIGRTKKKSMGMWYCYEIVAYLWRQYYPKFWRVDPEEFMNLSIWNIYFKSE